MYYAAQDVLEYLMNSTGGGAQEAEHRLLRAAAHHALRDVANARDWRWYETEAPLPDPEPGVGDGSVKYIKVTNGGSGYTTAPTVVFNNTGTGGSGATATAVVSGGVVTSVAVTAAGSGYATAPSISFTGGGGANAAAYATDYKVYVLPADVKSVDSIVPPDRTVITEFIVPREWRRLESYTLPTPSPLYWTVVRCPTKPDRWQMMFAGNPTGIDLTKTYYYTYRRQPQPLRYMGYEESCRDGSVSESGLVRRYGTAAKFPEGLSGINPYTAEEIIGLANSLIGTPPANAKTVVSDRLDLSSHMFTAVLSGAEMWMAKMQGKNVEGAAAVFARDMRLAMEADAITPISGQRSFGALYSPRAMGYYSPTQADTGV